MDRSPRTCASSSALICESSAPRSPGSPSPSFARPRCGWRYALPYADICACQCTCHVEVHSPMRSCKFPNVPRISVCIPCPAQASMIVLLVTVLLVVAHSTMHLCMGLPAVWGRGSRGTEPRVFVVARRLGQLLRARDPVRRGLVLLSD